MSTYTADARHAALAVQSRRRLLDVLGSAAEPQGVAELAGAVGLHVTTARFHLDVLERAGLVRRAAERGGRPGRPRQVYVAVAAPEANEGHRQLAAVLTGAVAAEPDGGAGQAERAGRRWAEELTPAGEALGWEEGTRRVRDLFDRLGFAPRLVDQPRHRHLELDACPFRDLARAYPDVVCGVHLGLLRGALGRLQVPSADHAGLRPFVAAELCIADVPAPGGDQEERCPAPDR